MVAPLLGYIRNAQGQPGCLQFDLVRQAPPTANHFALLQAWQDLPAQQAYAEAAGTKRFRAALLPISASPFDERLYWDDAVNPLRPNISDCKFAGVRCQHRLVAAPQSEKVRNS